MVQGIANERKQGMKKQYFMLSLLACHASVSDMSALPSKDVPRITIASALAGAAAGFGLSKYSNAPYNAGLISAGVAGVAALTSWLITHGRTPAGVISWADDCVAGLRSNQVVEIVKEHAQNEEQLLTYLDAWYGEPNYVSYPYGYSFYPRIRMVKELRDIIMQCEDVLSWLRIAQAEAQEHDNFDKQRCQKHYDEVTVLRDMLTSARTVVKKTSEYKEQKKIYDAVQRALAQRPARVEFRPVYCYRPYPTPYDLYYPSVDCQWQWEYRFNI